MQVRFEDLNQSLSRLPQVLQTVPDILRNPAANPLQAAILLAIALLVALVVVLSVFLLLMRSDELELAPDEDWDEEDELTEEEFAELERAEAHRRRMTRATVTGLIVLVTVGILVAAGYTTSRPEVCVSCHSRTSHTAAGKSDPHAKVACVDCHEGGGAFARMSVDLVTRVEHVALAAMGSKTVAAFGKPVASDACLGCHRKQIDGTYLDARLGVKVSHKEPIAAGGQCVDCHVLKSGVVGASTLGMSPCMRCHDGKRAKADCKTCHVGDPARAIRPTTDMNEVASAQVPVPDCGGCHKDMTSCNACHGLSMPHSIEFKQYGHARAGAMDIWTNNLRVCGRCHYPGHNDCRGSGCHVGRFPSHQSPDMMTIHQATGWGDSKVYCSCHQWDPYAHNGMNFCQICHATKPKGAKP